MNSGVIAVDGGGTRCRLTYDGQYLEETGPANVGSDFDGAITQLLAGVARLAARAGLAQAQLARTPIYLGLAGCVSPEISARVAARLPFAHILVEDDRRAAVRGALGQDDGAVAHCGTGSFLARQHHGQIRLAGGWGAVLGDEASACWVGRRALSLTLEACDAISPHSDLTRLMVQRFGGPPGIVAFGVEARAHDLGRIAPDVTARAAQGDPVARRIMTEGAAYLVRILDIMGHGPDHPLCLTGGIAAQYAPFLPSVLGARIKAPASTPLDGALALARAFAARVAPVDGAQYGSMPLSMKGTL